MRDPKDRKLNIYEILEKVSKAKTKEEKSQILKKNSSPALRTVLQGCYNPNVVLSLPKGNPPFEKNEEHNAPSNLLRLWKDFGYLVGNNAAKLGKTKVEFKFIQILESVHPKDADVVLQMKDKKPFKGLPLSLVREVFPDIVPPE